MVALPHYGFDKGPASPMHFIGNWGVKDITVPPIANKADDGTFIQSRSSETEGWFYTTSEAVTETWATSLNCTNKEVFNLDSGEPHDCWAYKNGEGDAEVIGCDF